MKPVVHLRAIGTEYGTRRFIKTLDHPSPCVTNWPESDGWVLTSPIVELREDGFETENTVYVKHPELFIETS